MRPLFFGTGARKLYGVYHPASPGAAPGGRSRGVLLCYPGVQEYNVTHAAFRKLATMLARSGLHVLRFDYFGTGDSSGAMGTGSPEEWVTDIRTAAAELSDLCGIPALSIVGFRLGAALAARAVSEGLAVQDLVLWDPVVVGRDYVKELEQKDRLQNLLLMHPTSRFQRMKQELLGYPFPPPLRASLEGIDLRNVSMASAAKIMLMVTEEHLVHAELRLAIARSREVRYEFVRENEEATNRGAREEVFLATKVLTAIRDAMVGQPS